MMSFTEILKWGAYAISVVIPVQTFYIVRDWFRQRFP